MSLSQTLKSIVPHAHEEVSSETVSWLQSLGLSEHILNELLECSFSSFVRVNKISFNKLNNIKSENLDEQNCSCIEHGQLIIGSGLNGDLIVLSIEQGLVGYVSHDELWEDEEDYEFSEIFEPSPLPLSEFFSQALENTFPVDAHECQKYAFRS